MKKQLLYEVSVIRPVVIILLLFMHCFTPYQGVWEPFDGFIPNKFYFWLARFITGFRIETIALIAGYVFSYQCRTLGREYPFISFVKKKAFRLLIPCYVFGISYYAMFYSGETIDVKDYILTVLNGAGHLWFLPMLFLCFISVWVLNRFRPNSMMTFCLFSVLSIVPAPAVFPLGLARYFHFLLFVYAGYLLWLYRDAVLNKLMKPLSIFAIVLLYASMVYCFEYVGNIYLKSIIEYVMNMSGIMALYLAVSSFTTKKGFELSPFVVNLSSQCYGLYVFHQYFLNYLYYETSFTANLGHFTPWITFVIILLLSFLVTKLFMKFRFGRFLIG